MQKTIQLVLSDSRLQVYPATPEVEKILTYTHKTIQKPEKGPARVVRKSRKFYRDVEHDGVRGMETFQGMWMKIQKEMEAQGFLVKLHDDRDEFPLPKLDKMHGFRHKQREMTEEFLSYGCSGLFGAVTRYGKCFQKGTTVMMYDGSIKEIQDIRNGDLVMGPDSKPRHVSGCVRGVDEMFRVTPSYGGMSWVCNHDHILHVTITGQSGTRCRKGQTENITIREWNAASNSFRHLRKLRRVKVYFTPQDIPLDPYIYGVWLGDGHSDSAAFTNMEPEVWEELNAWADKWGLFKSKSHSRSKAATHNFTTNDGRKRSGPKVKNPFRQLFRSWNKAHGIDRRFLINTSDVRLQVLAGLIDTDGEINNGTNLGFISKHRKLSEDVAFLCNSLGLGAVVHPEWKHEQTGPSRLYYRVGIRGDVTQIPLRVTRKRCHRKNKFNCLAPGFKVTPEGASEYYGFALQEADGLFLLSDCTVVHNTSCLLNILRAFPDLTTAVIAPGVDILKQLLAELTIALPERKLTLLGGGSGKKKFCDDITICSMDSMHLLDHDKVKLVLVDEVHELPTDARIPEFIKLTKARKYGFSGSLTGRFDGRDILTEALLGPVLVNKPYKEALTEGAICELKVIMLNIPLAPFWAYSRNQAYVQGLWMNAQVVDTIRYICDRIIPAEMQTLMFIQQEDQGNYIFETLGGAGRFAMAKVLTAKERQALTDQMKADQIKRCVASDIFGTGITFSNLGAVINACGGGASVSCVQKPGRLLQVMPGKRCGVLFEFMFELPRGSEEAWGQPWFGLVADSRARRASYALKGYAMFDASNVAEVEEIFKRECL